MRNRLFEKKSQHTNWYHQNEILKTDPENLYFSKKAATPTMIDQIVLPPARVWDKIEKVLDQQDERRNSTNRLIINSFSNSENSYKRKNLCLAAVAGVSVIAGLIWVAK